MSDRYDDDGEHDKKNEELWNSVYYAIDNYVKIAVYVHPMGHIVTHYFVEGEALGPIDGVDIKKIKWFDNSADANRYVNCALGIEPN